MGTTVELGTSSDDEELFLGVVDPRDVPKIWDQVEPLILEGKEHWEETHSLRDIYEMILSRQFHLWVAGDYSGTFLIALTEKINYPKMSELRIFFMSGSQLWRVFTYWECFNLYAKRIGCKKVVVFGRKGWKRMLAPFGYEEKWVYLERDISGLWEI